MRGVEGTAEGRGPLQGLFPSISHCSGTEFSIIQDSIALEYTALVSPISSLGRRIFFSIFVRVCLARLTLNDTCHETPGNSLCRAAHCKSWPILTGKEEFTSHTIQLHSQMFQMKFTASYKLSNSVYVITFRRCGQHYIGGSITIITCIQHHAQED